MVWTSGRFSWVTFEAPPIKLSDQFLTLLSQSLCLDGIVLLQSFLDPDIKCICVNLQVGIGIKAVIIRGRSWPWKSLRVLEEGRMPSRFLGERRR